MRFEHKPAPLDLFHDLDDMALQGRSAARRNDLDAGLPERKFSRKQPYAAAFLLDDGPRHGLMQQFVVRGFDLGSPGLPVTEGAHAHAVLGIEGGSSLGIRLVPGFGKGFRFAEDGLFIIRFHHSSFLKSVPLDWMFLPSPLSTTSTASLIPFRLLACSLIPYINAGIRLQICFQNYSLVSSGRGVSLIGPSAPNSLGSFGRLRSSRMWKVDASRLAPRITNASLRVWIANLPF